MRTYQNPSHDVFEKIYLGALGGKFYFRTL